MSAQEIPKNHLEPGWLTAYLQNPEWNESIGARFARIAARYPEKVAVESEAKKVTFSQLDLAANRLRSHSNLELLFTTGG